MGCGKGRRRPTTLPPPSDYTELGYTHMEDFTRKLQTQVQELETLKQAYVQVPTIPVGTPVVLNTAGMRGLGT